MLLSASGAMIMGEANDLIVVFLGLEILSIALYVLAAMNARRAESGEAALKYFVLGGSSRRCSCTDRPRLRRHRLTYRAQIADYLARNVLLHNGLLLAGMALLLVGFGFKVAAVPFHLWTPDVYQGSPSPATASWRRWPRRAGSRPCCGCSSRRWGPCEVLAAGVWVLAAITLLLGAVVALASAHQADARLLVDQPRRLRAARASRWPRRAG